ncbi:MAG: prolyl oligopeptidase family serine peptidase [Kiritimatiellae bacterium]|nr:prolyl oligopeptidase family serine peptidase [Kiritimatiellia bacterium]MDD5519732.1 prolyl oligopeptidase family serine peptidase [Kiritimatiellia bacterium]
MNKQTVVTQFSSDWTRRDMLRHTGLSALWISFFGMLRPSELHAATEAAAKTKIEPLPPLNHFSRMVHEYFVECVRQAEEAGNKQRAALRRKSHAQAYVKSVRERIQTCFGPWPEKTPLNSRVTGIVERDTYNIEKVIFESRPGLPVTVNLYVPKGRKFPLPGVVGTCGHSTNGKAAEAYQSFAQGLARMGYVALIYDPIGQGERFQYADEKFKSRIGPGVAEHLHAGNQQILVGEFFGSWRAWDGIRALDYLLTRPEVDPKQVGVTGNSGGGTMTTWLTGVEQRWCMSAPACFVTTFRRDMENELPADTEQCPPRALALGLDHSDFLAALAPKPVIILAKEKDYFDVRGSEEAFSRLQRLYKLLGEEKNIQLHIGPTYHGYTQENREAMYRWFNHVTKISDAQTEPTLTIEKDETLWCTPHGQVSELKPRTVFSFTQEKARALNEKRGAVSGGALKKAVTDVLKLPRRNSVSDYRILRPLSGRKYPAKNTACYAVETEPGIHAIVYRLSDEELMSRPPLGFERAILYVSHLSADVELREEPLISELIKAEPKSAFYTCDVRGIGESQPDTCGHRTFLSNYGNDYFYSSHSLMLDKPYLGQKTHDVLCVIDWLKSYGHKEIHLVAKGRGALAATFAALLNDSVVQVTLKNALVSYSAIAESEDYKWPLSTLLPGVLKHFDLPDCYRELESKKLRQIEPWGPKAEQG